MQGDEASRAPRFHAYLSRVKGQRLFSFPRTEWEEVDPDSDSAVLLDVSRTPLHSVAQKASFVASAAQEVSSTGAGIAIYRYDPNDERPFNVDKYAVLTGIQYRDDFDDLVASASTDADANLLGYLEENVFLHQLDKGPDHWLNEDEFPTQVRVIFTSRIDELA